LPDATVEVALVGLLDDEADDELPELVVHPAAPTTSSAAITAVTRPRLLLPFSGLDGDRLAILLCLVTTVFPAEVIFDMAWTPLWLNKLPTISS
jgi:hypothetical protein